MSKSPKSPSKPPVRASAKSSAAKTAAASPRKADAARGKVAAQPLTKTGGKTVAKAGGKTVAKPATKAPPKPAAKAPEKEARPAKSAAKPSSAGAAAAKSGSAVKAAVVGKSAATDKGGATKPANVKSSSAKSSARSGSSGRSSRKQALEPANSRSVAAAAIAAPKTDANGYVVINGRRVRMISTKDIQLSKRSRSADAKPAAAAAPVDISSIKTKLTKKELEPYKQLLLLRRAEILGLVKGMEQEALRSSGGNLSHMPIHMADIGTDTADQDFALNLAEKERETIDEIDAALQRVEDGTFGVCQATGKPIPKARLDAKPWAQYTIEAARMVESGHKFGS